MSGSGHGRGRLFARPGSLAVPLAPPPPYQRPEPPEAPYEPAEEFEPPAAAYAPPAAEAVVEAAGDEPGDDSVIEAGDEPGDDAIVEVGDEPEETAYGFEEPTLLTSFPADDEEATVNEWAALAKPEPEDLAEVVPAPLDDNDPTLPWNRPLARVQRNHVVGRFGGANPLAGATPAPVPPTRRSPPRDLGPPTDLPPEAPPPADLPQLSTAPVGTKVEASAPGKIILLGEHAVVYGHRAIAAAVSLTTTVTLHRRPGPSRVEETTIQDARLAAALATLVPAEGIGVQITSTLPTGCGMGSSAALAVAVVRALARLEGREATVRELVERGFELERVFHGNPSGLDHTVSASGGAVLFRKGSPVEALRVAKPLRFVIANTGTPSNTAEMVERVRQRNPTELIMRLGALVEMAAEYISRGAPVGGFLSEAHRCLRLMGTSTPHLDDLCRVMESAGSTGAKLSGGGGGGIAIALVNESTEDAVRKAAEPLASGGVFLAEIPASRG